MNILVDQKNNFKANFGYIFRSSGIFYCPKNLKTTISVMNYFKEKNSLEVGGIITKRKIDGELISRENVEFNDANVLNFVSHSALECSVEIEFFCNQNLRIPYAAVMAFYESEHSVSIIHNYGRNHSLIELEEKNALLNGRETCWFVSDTNRLSYNKFVAVFHNGHSLLPSQTFKLKVTQKDQKNILIEGEMPELSPFETYKFELNEILQESSEEIKSGAIWFRLEFESLSSFPRLLLIETSSNGELQVTHSDIDYESIDTNVVSGGVGYTKIPHIMREVHKPILEVDPGYPQNARISVGTDKNDKVPLGNGSYYNLDTINSVTFTEQNQKLPSRIHTALSGFFDEASLVPFRSCLGIVHKERPPKHTHWFPFDLKYSPTLEITTYSEIYPPISSLIEVTFKLYSPDTLDIFECAITYERLEDVPQSFSITEIISLTGARIKTDQPHYLLMNSNYGGFFAFVSHTSSASISIEHTF
jgi:hypothetical protein